MSREALQAARDLLADMPIPDGYYSASNEVIGLLDAALAAPQPEPVGEVVIGEEGMTKGWTVIKWRADLPPIAVGTKLYAAPQPQRAPLGYEQIVAIWHAHMKSRALPNVEAKRALPEKD